MRRESLCPQLPEMQLPDFLEVSRGSAPLLMSMRTKISRTMIDVNRDPSGTSLYPGQATTGLCPLETFDGEPLYRAGREPSNSEIDRRRKEYFDPYHAALATELARLRRAHPNIVLYDCHSIRSNVPRLFEGTLPHMNIGTHEGRSCDPKLQRAIEAICAASPFSWVSNGRFKGGWITRHYGRPEEGVHAVQMELACRSYLDEPFPTVDETNWPTGYDEARSGAMCVTLETIFNVLSFSRRAEG
jgi:formiminoglutamase